MIQSIAIVVVEGRLHACHGLRCLVVQVLVCLVLVNSDVPERGKLTVGRDNCTLLIVTTVHWLELLLAGDANSSVLGGRDVFVKVIVHLILDACAAAIRTRRVFLGGHDATHLVPLRFSGAFTIFFWRHDLWGDHFDNIYNYN